MVCGAINVNPIIRVTREAVLAAIEECIQKDILKEHLKSKRAEVVDIMMALFDRDLIQEMHDNKLE